MRRHVSLQQAVSIADRGANRVADHPAGIGGKLSDRAHPAGESTLRQSIYPKADLLAWLNLAHVALVDSELELEGVGASQGQQQVALLEEHTRDLMRGFIAKVVDDGRCNFHDAVAEPLPTTVFLELLGLPFRTMALCSAASRAAASKAGTVLGPDE